MSKQTAVDWLYRTHFFKNGELTQSDFEQAKAIEREQMLELIRFVRVHNKMGKSANDLLQQFETYKGGEQ